MAGNDPALSTAQLTFNQVLFSDLNNAGIFDMVSKSMAPPAIPVRPRKSICRSGVRAPANAAMVAFGAIGVQERQVIVDGWLFDAKNTNLPRSWASNITEALTPDKARHDRHEFADAIICAARRRINGIAESKIYYISDRSGNERSLGDGLRRRQSAPDHAPEFHLPVAAHLARWFAYCFRSS